MDNEISIKIKTEVAQALADIKGLKKETADLKKENEGLSSALGGLKAGYLAIAAVLTGTVVGALKEVAKKAAEFDDAMDSFRQTFGSVEKAAVSLRDELSKSFGYSRLEAVNLLTTLGQLGKGMGLSEQAALDLGGAVAKLGAAQGDFNTKNLTSKDFVDAFSAAVRGSTRQLEQFIGPLDEMQVANVAVEKGLAKVGEKLTDSARAQALLEIATRKSTDALLQFAEGNLSTEERLGRLNKRWEDLRISMGKGVLEAVGPLIEGLYKLGGVSGETDNAFMRFGRAVGFLLFNSERTLALLAPFIVGWKAVAVVFQDLYIIGRAIIQPFEYMGRLFVDLKKSWTDFADGFQGTVAPITNTINAIRGIVGSDKKTESGNASSGKGPSAPVAPLAPSVDYAAEAKKAQAAQEAINAYNASATQFRISLMQDETEKAIALENLRYENELANIKKLPEAKEVSDAKRLEQKQLHEQAINQIEEKSAEQARAREAQRTENTNKELAARQAAAVASLQGMGNLATAIADYESAEIKRLFDRGIVDDKRYKELMRKNAEDKKQAAIFQATINGAVAITQTMLQFGFPLGLIPAGLMAANTAAQIAAINAQPLPAFADGGLITKPTVGMIGEAGREAILPNSLTEFLIDAANKGSAGGGLTTINIDRVVADSPEAFARNLDRYARQNGRVLL